MTISAAVTQNITCSGGICVPTGGDAVLNSDDLESMLASGNVTVTTTGSGVQANDIEVSAEFSWPGANALTLDAYKSVEIDRTVSVRGVGGVSVLTNDGGTGGEFAFGGKGRLRFANLSDSLTINGAAYTLVRSVKGLARAIAANPAGDFALAKNYDAGRDGTFVKPPIPTVFSGAFHGLGNKISNLTINDPTENSYVGLFAETASGASIANLILANEAVTAASGSSMQSSQEFVGGVVGFGKGGAIANVSASGSVSSGEYSVAGGLVGIGGDILSECRSGMSVSDGYLGEAGGLVGGTVAGASIAHSRSTGNVSGSGFVGGLVGFNDEALIEHSTAAGTVTGTDQDTDAGGLAGINEGVIAKSSASGGVACQAGCGGLVGWNGGGPSGVSTILQSYATGNVSGTGDGGGLVGFNSSSKVIDSYATGSVSGQGAGGLIDDNSTGDTIVISRSYASGTVTATQYAGGLIGYDQFAGSIKRTYWDLTTSGISSPSQGAGNISDDPGIKGLSNAKLQSRLPAGFDPRIWAENPAINGGLPYLLDNAPPR
ncbi:MAG: GLUG motif-containing protein [Rhizomicrobium sp.]